MNTIERFFWGHMLAAVAALSIAFAMRGWGFCSLGTVLLGAIWLVMQQRKSWGWEGIMLFALVIGAAVALYLGAPAWLMLLATAAALGAWDLYSFLLRLSISERVEFASGLGRDHLRRLILVELVGVLAGLAALTFRAQVPFWWEALLVLLAVIGISAIIVRIRKETE